MVMEQHRRTVSAPSVTTAAELTSHLAAQTPSLASRPHLSVLGPDGEILQHPRAAFKQRPKRSWHTSAVDWHDKWTDSSWVDGRVLLIDYIQADHREAGRTKIAAQEIHDLYGLQKFYGDQDRCKQAALRVIHVQNAPWATKFLLRKFNIDHHDDLVGTDFGKWARFETPEWRAGRPLLKGKTFKTQGDPWRGVRRTGFGVDYLKPYDVRNGAGSTGNVDRDVDVKMMELNRYDDTDGATFGHDIYVQRLSVYIQHSDEDEKYSPDDVRNPYAQPEQPNNHIEAVDGNQTPHRSRMPPLDTLDNGNTIILFEHSQSGSVKDTLIAARDMVESRWRRLTFYLRGEDISTDDNLALVCMNMVLGDVLKALAITWRDFMDVSETHVGILEDKIYESPADESRASEIWANCNAWLKVEKLINIHVDVSKELIFRLAELIDEDETPRNWLDGTVEEYEKLASLVQEDLVKPTANLSDLMYKSVGIRDSRQSLQLGTSLWRLSWITFIFLPLTFVVGFFGMHVDTFENVVSIKWYFIAVVPLMLLILILWYALKHALIVRHQTPYQRGVYEHLFHDLAVAHPLLWSRGGPRHHIQPVGLFSKLKWRLLRNWFDPKKTLKLTLKDPDEETGDSGLGAWARFKRMLARRWLGSIRVDRRFSDTDVELGEVEGAVTELLAQTTPAGFVDQKKASFPVASVTMANLQKLSPPLRGRSRSRGRGRRGSSVRHSSSGGSSGVMVEERDLDDELEDAGPWQRGIRRSIDEVMGVVGRLV